MRSSSMWNGHARPSLYKFCFPVHTEDIELQRGMELLVRHAPLQGNRLQWSALELCTYIDRRQIKVRNSKRHTSNTVSQS